MEMNPAHLPTMQTIISLGHRGVPEPLDCSTAILDLCIRDKHRSATPQHQMQEDIKHHIMYAEHPSSTVGISSPGSSSETSEISTSSDIYRDINMQSLHVTKVKVPRPFKAYPKDPLSLRTGVTAVECIFSRDSAEAYTEFRNRMLAQVQATHGITNKNMRRNAPGTNNHTHEDAGYWEKRRKNNEAAKRSRDARRAKEDEIAIRAAFLEQENLKLRYEVAALGNELEKLRSVLYNHP